MAVKKTPSAETVNVTAGTTDESNAPITNASAGESANGASNGSTGHKRGPKGPRTTAPFEWSREMETAFVQVLSSPRKDREVRTASWVSYILNQHPAFKDNPVTTQQVSAHVDALQTKLPKNGLSVPSWLALDIVRRAPLDVDFWAGITSAADTAGAEVAE